VLARTPLVGHDVLDVGHPAPVVVAEPPGTLEPDLDGDVLTMPEAAGQALWCSGGLLPPSETA
jgi:hypothetical protein